MKPHIQSYFFKIKPGKEATWRAWCQEIETVYREPGLETLCQEGIDLEFFTLFKIDGQSYTCGTIVLEGSERIEADMSNELNQKHQAKMEECLELLGQEEVLYSLQIK